jgi:hypothetical protein
LAVLDSIDFEKFEYPSRFSTFALDVEMLMKYILESSFFNYVGILKLGFTKRCFDSAVNFVWSLEQLTNKSHKGSRHLTTVTLRPAELRCKNFEFVTHLNY